MKVLIFGYGNKTTAAVSNILLNLSKLIVEKDNIEIVLFGYGELNETRRIHDKVSIVSIKDPFSKGNFTCYRLKRKINHIFHRDDLCLSWKHLNKEALKMFPDKFDFVIGASGPFCYMNAAYKYSKKTNSKFGMIYFDPFTNNVSAINKKKRSELEKKWYSGASFIFEEKNAKKIPFEDSKRISLAYDIPIFEKSVNGFENGPIIYGGTFYESFRNEQLLLDFVKKGNCKGETFKVFSNKKEVFDSLDNVYSFGMVDAEDFDEECSNAKAIIVIGNAKDSKTYPSKLIGAISYRKPIIGINIDNDLIKYPYFYSSDDTKLFEKINALKKLDLEKLDLFKVYPNRNPMVMVNNLLESLHI